MEFLAEKGLAFLSLEVVILEYPEGVSATLRPYFCLKFGGWTSVISDSYDFESFRSFANRSSTKED